MTEVSHISVERIDRNRYEAETAGIFASFTRISHWDPAEIAETDPDLKAFDCFWVTGDGERYYSTLVVSENADMIDAIRKCVAEKAIETVSRMDSYLIVEQEIERRRIMRKIPVIGSGFKNENTFVITAGDSTFTFLKDTSLPHTKDGHPYSLYAYSDKTGTISGEAEIVGDHAPLYEFLPLVIAYWRIAEVRKHLVGTTGA